MSLAQMMEEIKGRPGFAENVGMILAHNGVVRGYTREGHRKVLAMEVSADEQKMGAICQELGARPGIFAISADAIQGVLKPGDDALYLVVAGDIRENVIAVLSELLNRIKNEAVTKREFLAEEAAKHAAS